MVPPACCGLEPAAGEPGVWLTPKGPRLLEEGGLYFVEGFDWQKGVRIRPLPITGECSYPVSAPALIAGPSAVCGSGYEGATINGAERSNDSAAVIEELLAAYPEIQKVLVVGGHFLPAAANAALESPLALLAEAVNICAGLRSRGISGEVLIYINDIHMSTEERRRYYDKFSLPAAHEELVRRCPLQRFYALGQKKACDRVLREKHRLLGTGKLERRLLEQGHAYFVNGPASADDEPFIVTFESKDSGRIRCVQACTKIVDFAEQLGHDALIQLYPICGRRAVELGSRLAARIYGTTIPIVNIFKTRDCFR